MKAKITLAMMGAAICWLGFDNWRQSRRIGSLEDDLGRVDMNRLEYAVTQSDLDELSLKFSKSFDDADNSAEVSRHRRDQIQFEASTKTTLDALEYDVREIKKKLESPADEAARAKAVEKYFENKSPEEMERLRIEGQKIIDGLK